LLKQAIVMEFAKKIIKIKKCHPIFCYKAAVCSISILLSTGMSDK
jgi:hypothetical protein